MTQHQQDHDHHIISRTTYFIVYVTLLVLMVATIGMAYVDLGESVNLAIAMAIASMKAILIVLIFMHVYYSNRVVKLFVGASFFWLIILYLFTFADFFVRWG